METFTAHRLHFEADVLTTVELNEHQGSALRGALFHALRGRFCGNAQAGECARCPLAVTCPVALLVSTLRPESERGRDVPRPYTIQPPLPGAGGHAVDRPDGSIVYHYEPGERLAFGLTLYAQALQLFPYVVLATQEFERGGIGRRIQRGGGRWLRGAVAVRAITASNPITNETRSVLAEGGVRVHVPDIGVTHEQVSQVPTPPPGAAVSLRFLTPTRIIRDRRLLKPDQFAFQPLFQRLMDRVESLSVHFSDTPLVFDDAPALIAAAGRVRATDNRLLWEELTSYSTRRRGESPISGLLGSVELAADDWTPFWPLLIWGQFVHVGKDAVKGNGWYALEEGGLDAHHH